MTQDPVSLVIRGLWGLLWLRYEPGSLPCLLPLLSHHDGPGSQVKGSALAFASHPHHLPFLAFVLLGLLPFKLQSRNRSPSCNGGLENTDGRAVPSVTARARAVPCLLPCGASPACRSGCAGARSCPRWCRRGGCYERVFPPPAFLPGQLEVIKAKGCFPAS